VRAICEYLVGQVLAAVPVVGRAWVSCLFLVAETSPGDTPSRLALGGKCSDLLGGRMPWVLVRPGVDALSCHWERVSVLHSAHAVLGVPCTHIAVVIVLVTVAAWVVISLLHHVGHVYAYLFVAVCFVCWPNKRSENAFHTSAGTCPTAGSFSACRLLPWVAVPREWPC
jgi:hypothetical protein